MVQSRSRRVRRAIGTLAAGGILATVGVVGTAGSASAHEGSIDHFCGSLRMPDDNGPITDVLHHVLEDPVRPLGLSYLFHGHLCYVAGIEWDLLTILGQRP